MIVPPPITREAREWLLERMAMDNLDSDSPAYERGACFAWKAAYNMVANMPLTLSFDLDAVRARFQPNETQEVTATDGDYALGYNGGYVTVWRVQDGAHWLGHGPAKPLQRLSPHAALIAELREQAENHDWFHQMRGLFKRAADALEKLP